MGAGSNGAQAQMGPRLKWGPGPNRAQAQIWGGPFPNGAQAKMGPRPKLGPSPIRPRPVAAFSERIGQGNKIDIATHV